MPIQSGETSIIKVADAEVLKSNDYIDLLNKIDSKIDNGYRLNGNVWVVVGTKEFNAIMIRL